MVLTILLSLIRRPALDLGLNDVKGCDFIKCLFGQWRAIYHMHIKELAPDMGPAGGFGYVAFFEDGVEARIAIGMENPFEVPEMRLRIFAPRLREGRLLRSGE